MVGAAWARAIDEEKLEAGKKDAARCEEEKGKQKQPRMAR